MRILLAVDDSKFSMAATRMLITQHQPRGVAVRVLHVVEPIETAYYPELTPPYPMDFSDINKQRLKDGRALADRIARKIHAAGFKVDSAVSPGHVRSEIVDAAKKWRANLIMMGSHGRRGLQRFLLGSVSEYVVRHAPCSVQIVRPSKRT